MDTGEAIVSPTLLSPVLSFTIGSGTSGFAGSLVPTISLSKFPSYLKRCYLFVHCSLLTILNGNWNHVTQHWNPSSWERQRESMLLSCGCRGIHSIQGLVPLLFCLLKMFDVATSKNRL